MSDDFPITVFHNSACGTSRNTIGAIENAGFTPTIVEYLKTGWTRPQLDGLLAEMHAKPRDILRGKEKLADELGLNEASASDEAILGAMVAHPILVNRPIVRTPKGTKLCRPSETVLDLLPAASEPKG